MATADDGRTLVECMADIPDAQVKAAVTPMDDEDRAAFERARERTSQILDGIAGMTADNLEVIEPDEADGEAFQRMLDGQELDELLESITPEQLAAARQKKMSEDQEEAFLRELDERGG